MKKPTDDTVEKLILILKGLANKLERFRTVSESRMNRRASIWFYDHAKAHYESFKSLSIYALITQDTTHWFETIPTEQMLKRTPINDSYWIDEANPDFLNDVIGKLDQEKATWGRCKSLGLYKMLWNKLSQFLTKEREEIKTYLQNDIVKIDPDEVINEIDQINTFLNIAIAEIPLEYWKGEVKNLANAVKKIEIFLVEKRYHTWLTIKIKQKILPEIGYLQGVFGFQTPRNDYIKGLLEFMQIDGSKIIECFGALDLRLDEIKQIQSKIDSFCEEIKNQYVAGIFMLHEKLDANGMRLDSVYFDDVVKELEDLSKNQVWLTPVLQKAKEKQKIVEDLKTDYCPEKTAQINEFLCEVKIAQAIASEGLKAECDYKTNDSNNKIQKGQAATDIDFKIDTPEGSILLEVTSPRKSDFIKEHTFYTPMKIGGRDCQWAESAYKETPEHIKADAVLLNKCSRTVCACHKKAIQECPDKKHDNDHVVKKEIVPIKFPLKQNIYTLHAIVVFEKDLLTGNFDVNDCRDIFFYGASPELPGLLCRNDDAAHIFQERIDSVCFIKQNNYVYIYYHPRFQNQKLKVHFEKMLRQIGKIEQINIDQELSNIIAGIQKARIAQNLSFQKLAAFVNVDAKDIEDLEKKTTVFDQKDFETLYKVSELLRINRGNK